jgi:hypothetical protein
MKKGIEASLSTLLKILLSGGLCCIKINMISDRTDNSFNIEN